MGEAVCGTLRWRLLVAVLVLAGWSLCPLGVRAQIPADSAFAEEWSLGPGYGLDHGGLGVKAAFRPVPCIRVFAAAGATLAGFGYNGGVEALLLPRAKFCPYALGMYGTNAVLSTRGTSGSNTMYSGPSAGIGVALRTRLGHWTLAALLPFRSDEFETDRDLALRRTDLDVLVDPWPVLVGLGYHWRLCRAKA
jgi:hypothetical protein